MKKLTRVQRKKRRRRIFIRIILLLFLVFLVFILTLKTDLFLIDNIKVMGNNKILHTTIIDVSNIEYNENIFKINIKDSIKNMEELPYVKEAMVKRKFPKSIIMEIIERKEALQVKNISSFVIIDKEGYILDIVDEKKEGLPEFIGFEVGKKSPGENFFSDIEGINVDFIEEGQRLNMLVKMEEVYMSENNNINILLLNGIDVAFGTIDNVNYKLGLLKEVLKDIEKKNLQCKMILMDRGENPVIVLEEEEG